MRWPDFGPKEHLTAVARTSVPSQSNHRTITSRYSHRCQWISFVARLNRTCGRTLRALIAPCVRRQCLVRSKSGLNRYVADGPKATSFDHLIRSRDNRCWDRQPDCIGSQALRTGKPACRCTPSAEPTPVAYHLRTAPPNDSVVPNLLLRPLGSISKGELHVFACPSLGPSFSLPPEWAFNYGRIAGCKTPARNARSFT